MTQALREFFSGDAFVALLAIAAAVSAFVAFKIWRSPQSWHIDDETKDLRFHGWPQLAMAAAFALALAIFTILTF